MATYYSSPGSERDSQTLYSTESGNASYPMPSALGNLLYSNNASSGPYTEFSGIIQPQQNFMELPGHPSAMSHGSSSNEATNMGTSLTEQRSFGPLKDLRNEMLMHLMDGAQGSGSHLIHNDAHNTAQIEFGMLNNDNSTSVPSAPGQGLSLSLNTHILAPSYPYWSAKPDLLTPNSYQGDDNRMKNMQSEASRAIRNSKYLKAAQELLDEIVSVWKSVKNNADKGPGEAGKADGKETGGGIKSEGVSANPQESGANAAAELSAAEKQELQNKMAKLMAMLDEVCESIALVPYHFTMMFLISNWFINARVRLWKPMIEDMYKEEIGDAELDSNSSSDNGARSKDKAPSSEEKEEIKTSTSQVCQSSQLDESEANVGGMMSLSGAPTSGFHNEANPEDSFMSLMLKAQRPGETDGSGLLHHSDESTQFMAYHLAELGRYNNNNVSLTLGLQHAENSLSSAPNTQPGFSGVRDEGMYNTTPLNVTSTSSDYESTNQMDQQQRQQFEPLPLMHDFVA
ncbi:hypothetical protein HU200_045248 [Digitaria exilis]|uniref:POX domain-containing protein n=1 Tax=Digitaria exilis TaxID=1010633 RepID=A0A835EEM9_9POAL|nr:hypothetical protein HU200_045248 [Digitaria exilis]